MAVERLVSGSVVFIFGKGLQLSYTRLNIQSGGSDEKINPASPGSQTPGLKVLANE
jgi:hypothetical protein